ncbi:transcriptional regulator, XRE family, partial [mine drainage metagenome]
VVDALIDVIGDDESHPLAEVLDYLSDQVEAYEDEHTVIPEASPAETLRFLMQQHELKQEDLIDYAPQSRISDILNGRRAISKDLAKKTRAAVQRRGRFVHLRMSMAPPPKAPRRSNQELVEALEHLRYEYSMLLAVAEVLSSSLALNRL